MSEQVPIGIQQNPEPMKKRGTVTRDVAIAALAVMITMLCLVGALVVSRIVRDVVESRIGVLELSQKMSQLQAKTTELEKRIESEGQRLTGMIENHNKLVQALNGVFTLQEGKFVSLDAKIAVIDAGVTNVVERIGKLEREKKR